MTIYQLCVYSFYESNGIEYAAPVGMMHDIKLYKNYNKALKVFDKKVKELINFYNVEEPKTYNKIGTKLYTKIIKYNNGRTYVELLEKQTN